LSFSRNDPSLLARSADYPEDAAKDREIGVFCS
jgi:hypothetical protein